MAETDVQDQHTPEELTDEQADAKFDAQLRGTEGGESEPESPAPEPEGTEARSEGDEAATEVPEENIGDLQKERDALKKELSRVRGGKREEQDRVSKLEAELQDVRAKIKDTDPKKNPIDEWDLATTMKNMRGWREKVEEARDAGDEAALKQAKVYLGIIEDALPQKIVESGQAQSTAQSVEQQVEKSVTTMTEMVMEKFPDVDFSDRESALVKEAMAEQAKPEYAALNSSVGESIASQLTMLRLILKNPSLLNGKAKPDKVLKDVNKSLTKASMSPGAKNKTVTKETLATMSDEEQDKVMEELMRGSRESL